MPDDAAFSSETVLSEDERQATESLLASVWGSPVTVGEAELIWGRRQVARVTASDGRTAVLKRRPADGRPGLARGFGAEVAALEFLGGTPVAIAPRLLGVDPRAGILLMEDLGAGGSLAHALLATDPVAASEGLVAYARSMASLHAWSTGRSAEFEEIRARRAPGVPTAPHWADFRDAGKDGLLQAAADLGLPPALIDGAAAEIGTVASAAPRYPGLVHGDLCPDNTSLSEGSCRIFDFETSGWGSVAIDAAYLLAPFPSCWCFAALPPSAADAAMTAYRSVLLSAGISLGPDWDAELAVALGTLVVARGRRLPGLAASSGPESEPDDDWGTTTLRPRLLTWLRSFTGFPAAADALPRLHALALRLLSALETRWGPVSVPSYPALARPGDMLTTIPDGWDEL
jgi:Ser/Thr protein kinase RdoA (MazF antagonist)